MTDDAAQARANARVRDGVLAYRDGGEERLLPVGGGAWARWLERPETSAFRFEQGAARFTARRERQRDRWYWYAYRRRDGRLRKAYLGRSRDLSRERLEAVAARLDDAAVDPTSAALPVPSAPFAADPDGPAVPDPPPGSDRHNLPHPVSSFLGRRVEVAELRRLLGAARLVTLTGAGGIGKTRLAVEVAASTADAFPDGAWFVDLADVADPTLVPQAVARAVGAREQPGQPLPTTLATALGAGPTLLVLDNCEHVVDACARLAASLLGACPSLRLLATSREPLRVPGEVAWRVPSLGLPEDHLRTAFATLAASESVRLFVERAEASRPGFALTDGNAAAVAEVCRRLDGIPLAIELAAARIRLLAPAELAARLDDRFRLLGGGGSRTAPPRQQTLRATVDWSYDLLADEERRGFERLAVFAGGFTLDAAEWVIGDGPVLDLLGCLVDRSLVLAEPPDGDGPTRYHFLETLRAYAAERLTERGEAERAQTRHADWVAAMARRAAAAFQGPEQGYWLRWAEREQDNAREALAWAIACGETDLAVAVAAAFSWPWLVHQRWSEGLDWARRVLALPGAAPTQERGLLLLGAVQLAIFRGDLASNRPSGDLAPARAWLEECLAIGVALGDDYLVLGAHGTADLLREFGVETERVPPFAPEQGLAEAVRVGDRWGERRALEALSRHALARGDAAAAGAWLEAAAQSAREDGDGWSLAMALNALGDVERVRGAHARAGPLYAESAAVFAGLGLPDQPNLVHNQGYVALAAGDRTDAAARFAGALVQFRRLGERRGMAECLIGLGAVAAAGGHAADAVRLVGAGEGALAAAGATIWPANRPDVERWLARARTARTAADFDRALAEGRLLPLDQAAAWALDRLDTTASTGTPARAVGVAAGANPAGANPAGAMGSRPAGAVDDAAWSRTARSASAPSSGDSPLTRRQGQVLRLLAEGRSDKEIAAALFVSPRTASKHVAAILAALGADSRTAAVALALRDGLA